MRSISQERAKFAYEKAEAAIRAMGSGKAKEFSSFVSGIPAMILQNGLGHTLCFLLAKAADQSSGKYKTSGEGAKYWLTFDAVVHWLSQHKMLSYNPQVPVSVVENISAKDAFEYMAIQEETLRFLEWFKVMSKMFV